MHRKSSPTLLAAVGLFAIAAIAGCTTDPSDDAEQSEVSASELAAASDPCRWSRCARKVEKSAVSCVETEKCTKAIDAQFPQIGRLNDRIRNLEYRVEDEADRQFQSRFGSVLKCWEYAEDTLGKNFLAAVDWCEKWVARQPAVKKLQDDLDEAQASLRKASQQAGAADAAACGAQWQACAAAKTAACGGTPRPSRPPPGLYCG